MSDSDQKAIEEILDYIDTLPEPGDDVSDNFGDCQKKCREKYDACMADAGSTLEKAACKAKYNKCVSNC